MFSRFAPQRDSAPQIRRIEALIRRRFDLPESELVIVTAERATAPGLPAEATVIIFWLKGARYRLKLFKSLDAIAEADLPVRWLLPFYEDNGDLDCC